MAAQKDTDRGTKKLRGRTFDDPEVRENYMIGLSMDCAEEMLMSGKAPAQLVVHFLKLGTKKAELELEKLKHENELTRAKTEQIEAEKKNGELYAKAIAAMSLYNGQQVQMDEEEDV